MFFKNRRVIKLENKIEDIMSPIEMQAGMQNDGLYRIVRSKGLLDGLAGQSLTDQLSKYNTNDYYITRDEKEYETYQKCKEQEKQ